jgi:hypothetical protein
MRWILGVLGLTAAIFAALPARAQEPLQIEVTGADEARVRAAITREIATLDPPPRGALGVKRDGMRATIVYVSEDGRRLERVLDLQRDPIQSAEEIALVAASLVRDEPDPIPPDRDEAFAVDTPPPPAPPRPAPPRPAPKARSPRLAGFDGATKLTTPPPPPRIGPCSRDIEVIPLGVDFAPFVGTSSFPKVRETSRAVAFNFLGGVGAGLTGFELGFLNIETELACGVQVATLGNFVAGDMTGFALAAVLNVASGRVTGFQMASALNVAGDGFAGFQLGGVANVVSGHASGLQHGNVLNVATEGFDGLQVGTINVVGGRVRGVQIGVVNVAEKSDFSLGVVSVNYGGRTHLDLWSELEVGVLGFALKHGGDHWHAFYGVSTRLTEGSIGGVLGVGGHVRVSDRVYLDLDAVITGFASFEANMRATQLVQARPVVGVNLVDELAIYAGATYNVLFANGASNDWSPGYAVDLPMGGDATAHMWPGAILGVQALAE